ncbi:CDGSH iron-sulfur domain-containing protein [Pseudomonas mangiferae]|uniref:CDGSH iron-sulfur domain-containing protein n=1 Tax=Pseudomonas mangiferae TaxID=2593654 RepID=A0A553GUL3_9PSED|nr:CDGSH iron-sulfur domain-containing protein [Pseudomonas mangiferae]
MEAGGDPRKEAPPLPEARRVRPGEALHLCTCRRSPYSPDCPATCGAGLRVTVARERLLLLCRCGGSRQLPWCDGSHVPPTPSLRARWRRFLYGEG